jgi:hypothetical protein
MQKLNLSLFDLVELAEIGDNWPWRIMYDYNSSGELLYKGLTDMQTATNAAGWWIMKYHLSNGTLIEKSYWSNDSVKWSDRTTLGWRF